MHPRGVITTKRQKQVIIDNKTQQKEEKSRSAHEFDAKRRQERAEYGFAESKMCK